MDYYQAIFIGSLQGFFEWLPISSEGQLVLASIYLFKIDPSEALSYAIMLHLGTLLVVLIKYWRTWISLFSGSSNPLLQKIVLVTIGTMVTGIPLYFFIAEFFSSGEGVTLLIGLLLIITGVILWYSKAGTREFTSLTKSETFGIGLIQGLAILPGISRSGVTITSLLMRNVHPESALTFSFLISVPPVIGALVINGLPESFSINTAIIMIISAFITGALMMELLLRISKKVNFQYFCLILGILIIITEII